MLSMNGKSFVALTQKNPLQISLKMNLLLKSYACCVLFCFANCKKKNGNLYPPIKNYFSFHLLNFFCSLFFIKKV
jgi:hypothetical protein